MKVIKFMNIVLIFVLACTITVYAEYDTYARNLAVLTEYQIIETPYYTEIGFISRLKYVTALMKAIGAMDQPVIGMSDFIQKWVEVDGYTITENGELIWYGDPSSKEDGTYCLSELLPYIGIATYTGIVKGEVYDGNNYFCADRDITLAEAMLLMMRCLGSLDLNDSELALQQAEERGLITQEDIFYSISNARLTPEMFCTIMVRFLDQPRTRYFPNYYGGFMGVKDTNGRITYLKYLMKRKECIGDPDAGDEIPLPQMWDRN